jgi:hypothetical protein
MSNEISDTDQFPAMPIHKRLIPRVSLLVPDLQDVREGDGPVGFDEVFECWLYAVVFPVQGGFDGGKSGFPGYGGGGGGDFG